METRDSAPRPRECKEVPPQVRRRPSILVPIVLGLLAFVASEAMVEVRLALRTPDVAWSGLVSVLGLGGLPFVAPFAFRGAHAFGWRSLVCRVAAVLALTYAPAALFALAFAPHPLRDAPAALGLAVLSALAGLPALLPAAVYARRTGAPDPAVVALFVAASVLMPIPFVGGSVLALLLLWRPAPLDFVARGSAR